MKEVGAHHTCLRPGCQRLVSQSHLACRPHWYELSPALRNRIWDTFRASDTLGHRRAMVDALGEWQALDAKRDDKWSVQP